LAKSVAALGGEHRLGVRTIRAKDRFDEFRALDRTRYISATLIADSELQTRRASSECDTVGTDPVESAIREGHKPAYSDSVGSLRIKAGG
jgi:hypothetical protein